MATPKEIQARIKLLTTEAEKLNQIYQLDNRRTTALKESLKIQREILKLENLMKGVYGDISKTLVTVAKKSKEIKFNQKDTFGFQKNLNKQVAENLKLNMV